MPASSAVFEVLTVIDVAVSAGRGIEVERAAFQHQPAVLDVNCATSAQTTTASTVAAVPSFHLEIPDKCVPERQVPASSFKHSCSPGDVVFRPRFPIYLNRD